MIGRTIGGKYRILELIGSGGMAKVYKAEHLLMNRPAALKIIDPYLLEKDPGFAERFLNEARIGFGLHHSNIVQLMDAGEENSTLFMVMNFIEGKSLKEMITGLGPLPVAEAVEIIKGVAAALDYIHSRGLIHRDIKSGNIMIRQGDHVPILMDFGIAKTATSARLTQTGYQMGTPEYMSPEQADGRQAAKASDIYALGIVAYEMLTGRVPFSADTPTVTLLHHLTKTAAPINALRPDVSLGAGNAVMRAMAKNPDDRYATAGDFARALEIGESSPPPPSAETRIVTPVGRETPQVAQAPRRPSTEVRERIAPAGKAISPPSLVSKPKPVLLFASLLGAAGIMVIVIALGLSLGWFGGGKKPAIAGGGGGSAEREKPAGQTKPSEPAPVEQTKPSEPAPVGPASPPGSNVGQPPSADNTGMVFISAGEFWMGCSPGDNACDADEKPRVNVYIDGFFMDKHEVTQGEYERVMGSNPSHFSNCGDDCPVENVTWNDAKSYCGKVGKRLPTEAEWEKAARGGTGSRYYWGGNMNGDYAWYRDNSQVSYSGSYEGKGTHPVGQRKPNGYGLYDTAGNVWEWVEDCYDIGWYVKLSSGQRNPMNSCTDSSAARVLRGGSWSLDPALMRVSYRVRTSPVTRLGHSGFRCSLD